MFALFLAAVVTVAIVADSVRKAQDRRLDPPRFVTRIDPSIPFPNRHGGGAMGAHRDGLD